MVRTYKLGIEDLLVNKTGVVEFYEMSIECRQASRRSVDKPAARAASFASSFPHAVAARAKALMTEEKRMVVECIN